MKKQVSVCTLHCEIVFTVASAAEYFDRDMFCLPNRRLPPETLAEIFMALVTGHEYGRLIIPSRKYVLLPGQICGYWREVAISTPSLWASVRFDIFDAKSAEREMDMGRTWLPRTGNFPLTLELRCYWDVQIRLIIDMIIAHSAHWHTVSFKRAPQFILDHLPSVRGCVPLLHSLSIHILGIPRLLPERFDAFDTAPQLRILHLESQISRQMPDMRWMQLQELSFCDTFDVCLDVLRCSPNLLVYNMQSNTLTLPRQHSIIQHHYLQELQFDVGWGIGVLFDTLTLPELDSLICINHGESWPRDQFISFLHRSLISTSLQTLIISSDDIDPDYSAVIECLRHTPNLSELSLLNRAASGIGSRFFRHLTRRVAPSALESDASFTPCLLPKLLHFEVTRFMHLEYDALADMVQSRWRGINTTEDGVERIETIRVQFVDYHDELEDYHEGFLDYLDDFARLREFRAEGLDIIAPDIDLDGRPCSQCCSDSASEILLASGSAM